MLLRLMHLLLLLEECRVDECAGGCSRELVRLLLLTLVVGLLLLLLTLVEELGVWWPCELHVREWRLCLGRRWWRRELLLVELRERELGVHLRLSLIPHLLHLRHLLHLLGHCRLLWKLLGVV